MEDDYEEELRAIARALADELENRGALTTLAEARAVDKAEGNLICKRCSNPVSVQDEVCNRCGARQAVDADEVRFRCEDCGMPISDPNTARCPACRGTKVQRAGAEPFECIRCGHGISDPERTPECPECGETRAVKRIRGHPARNVVTGATGD